MMLDINFTELRQGFLRYLPLGLAVGLVLLLELAVVAGAWVIAPAIAERAVAPTPAVATTPNTEALGQLIYTNYVYFFQSAGLILLVAMIGAIVLTHRTRPAYVSNASAIKPRGAPKTRSRCARFSRGVASDARDRPFPLSYP